MDALSERLRNERERQRRSLRDISVETKIREPFLEAIERGEYTVLPSIYVRSFVRTYAAALGLSADEALAMLDASQEHTTAPDRFPSLLRSDRPSRKASPPPPPTPVPSSQGDDEAGSNAGSRQRMSVALDDRLGSVVRAVPLLLWIALAAAVLGGGGWLLWSTVRQPAEQAAADSTSVVDVQAVDATPAGSDQDSIILTATITDTVWVNITMDGKVTNQAVLRPGDAPRWSALEKFQLSIGNAGGLIAMRDGVALPPFGGKDEVVRAVTITRKDVTSSSTIFRQTPASAQPRPPASAPASATPATPAPAQQRQPVRQRTPTSPQRATPTPNRRPAQQRSTTRRTAPVLTPAPLQPPPRQR